MMAHCVSKTRRKGSQSGFTMVELMVAIVLFALIMVGTVAILGYMVVRSEDNGDRTLAQLQAYYVGFWIGQDVVQAQGNITSLANSTIYCDEKCNPYGNITVEGFPLKMQWIDSQYGDISVTYDVQTMEGVEDENHCPLLRLNRTQVGGPSPGNATIAEYIHPLSTKCYEKTIVDEGESKYSIVVEVTAKVDRREASSIYEISPRVQ